MLKLFISLVFVTGCLSQKIAKQKCEEYSALAKAKSDSPQCLVFDSKDSGVQVENGEFPATALLGYVKENSTDIRYICDGELISEDTILAAGHCLRSLKDKPKMARIGATHSTLGIEVEVAWSECHPDYNPGNDIAVVKLKQKVESTYIPACLDTEGVTSGVTVAGVGRPITTQYPHLREKSPIRSYLEIKPHQQCVDVFPQQNISSESTLCVKDPLGGVGDCLSGPLYVSRDRCVQTVVGISSFGHICISQNVNDSKPSVYTAVKPFVPWIESLTWPTTSV